MTSTFFQRILILVLSTGCMTGLHAQEYKYEIGGMAGGAFYMGDVNKNAFFKGLPNRQSLFYENYHCIGFIDVISPLTSARSLISSCVSFRL